MNKSNTGPVVVAISNDHHAASTVGLCPPRVALDDGGEYRASPGQRWLWRNWTDYTVRAKARATYLDAPLVTIFNGDLTDGNHHRTTQVVTGNETTQMRIAYDVIAPLVEQSAAVYVIRGTEAHVGPSASLEEKIAEDIGAVKDEIGTWSSWHRLLDINGTVFDLAHHGNLGRLPWTRANTVNQIAATMLYAAGRYHTRVANLIMRAHLHQYADSGVNHLPVRVIACPGWQLPSAYVHRIAPGAIADIGGLIITCYPGGTYEVDVVLYRPDVKRPEKVKLERTEAGLRR
jgi:hypothetical protein